MTIRVSVVEDDRGLRETLVHLLGCAPGLRCVSAFGCAEEALAGMGEDWPDVILLDLQLPGMGGAEFLRRVKRMRPGVRVLTFTQHADEERVFEAIRAGADGYALKRGGLGQIEAGLHAVHRGEGFFPPSIARKLAMFVHDTPPGCAPGSEEYLTDREKEVLRWARHGLDNKAIAQTLGCAYSTVRTHWDNIRAKLGAGTRAEAVAKYFHL